MKNVTLYSEIKNVTNITPAKAKANKQSDYNQFVWIRNIDSYAKYKNVKFYETEIINQYGYSDIYVQYTIETGMQFFSKLSYSHGLSSNGFVEVIISSYSSDVNGIVELPEGKFQICVRRIPFNKDGKTEFGSISNTEEGRKYMINHTSKCGSTWTNESI